MIENKVKYDINAVTGRLSAKIANLEVALAHEQAAKEAYIKRVEELQEEQKRLQKEHTKENAAAE